jgi:hypothetical protein
MNGLFIRCRSIQDIQVLTERCLFFDTGFFSSLSQRWWRLHKSLYESVPRTMRIMTSATSTASTAFVSKSVRCLIFLVLFTLIHETHALSNVDDWRSRSIYQVITDRFARTDGSTTAPCVLAENQYCGGTWQGIINKLDYIQGMGFTAVSQDSAACRGEGFSRGLWIVPGRHCSHLEHTTRHLVINWSKLMTAMEWGTGSSMRQLLH